MKKILIWCWIFFDYWKKLGKEKNSRLYMFLSRVAFLPFILMRLYSRSMTFLTKYFPFSLMFTEAIFHYENRYYKFARKIIEDEMRKDQKALFIDEGDQDQYYYTLIGKFTNQKVRNPDTNILHIIEKN